MNPVQRQWGAAMGARLDAVPVRVAGARYRGRFGWLLGTALGCAALALWTPTGSAVRAQTPPPAAAAAGNDAARNAAGKIDLVAGTVTVVGADQKQRTPKKGDKLFEGDSIVTEANGELHAELTDGAVLAVRPNTAMLISKYQANGDAADTSVFSLLKGSFRSITGWIGKSNQANYKIITPTVTIGVRGTDHEPSVIPEGAKEGAPGTYDRVHAGASFIESPSGRVDVAQGRAGFSAAHGRERPRVLDQVPAFYRPARNDQRLAGRHEQISKSFEARRSARQQAVRTQRTQTDARKSAQEAAQTRRAAQEQRRGQQAVERKKNSEHRQQRQQEAQQKRQVQQQARQSQTQAAQQRAGQARPKAQESHSTPQQRAPAKRADR